MSFPTGFDPELWPLLFAHRGLRTEYPENTMAAFQASADSGIPGIELDVHITRDAKIVVIHDDNLKRVGNSPLVVEQSSWAELAGIDVGSHMHSRFGDQRIPLLEEVLASFGDRCYFDIELKNGVSADRGLSAATAEVIRRVAPSMPLLVSSFNPLELRRFRRLRPDLATAVIYSRDTEVPWYLRRGQGIRIAGSEGAKPEYPLTPRRRGRVRRHLRWQLPWTVNDRESGRLLLERGAVGLVSDDPRPFLSPQATPGCE